MTVVSFSIDENCFFFLLNNIDILRGHIGKIYKKKSFSRVELFVKLGFLNVDI